MKVLSIILVAFFGNHVSAGISREDCEAHGGLVVGDIGDGSIFAPSYTCEADNLPPVDFIVYADNEAIAIEGEVCCGGDWSTSESTPPQEPEPEADVDSSHEACHNVGGIIVDENEVSQIADAFSCTRLTSSTDSTPIEYCCEDIVVATDDGPPGIFTREHCVDAGGTVVETVLQEGSTSLCESKGLLPIADIINLETGSPGAACCGGPLPHTMYEQCLNEGGIVIHDETELLDFNATHNCDPLPGSPAPLELCCKLRDTHQNYVEYTRQECKDIEGIIESVTTENADEIKSPICETNKQVPYGVIVEEDGGSTAKVCCGPEPFQNEDDIHNCVRQGGLVVVDESELAEMEANDFVCDPMTSTAATTADDEDPIEVIPTYCCLPSEPSEEGDPEQPSVDPVTRAEYTKQECLDAGGEVVGDIGDGAVFTNDYKCESNGLPPLANVVSSDLPIAVEGEVCCGAASGGDPEYISAEECEALGGMVVSSLAEKVTSCGVTVQIDLLSEGTDAELCCFTQSDALDQFALSKETDTSKEKAAEDGSAGASPVSTCMYAALAGLGVAYTFF
eukprot:Nitzschia sp. Nitz4//scaffold40_size135432//109270//110964//NITZ4_003263-RA/size135432-processed-gene-0.49-mRNA-1//1//CDS//3329551276//2132//frame0